MKNEQEDDLDNNNSAIDVVEKFENSNQILRTMRSVTERAERQIDILFAQYLIQKMKLLNS